MEPLQAWAVVEAHGRTERVVGGEFRCAIFWTRAGAKREQVKHANSRIVRVIVNELFAAAVAREA